MCPLEKEMKQKGRGVMVEKIRCGNTQLSMISWYDNKVVSTVSTYVGSETVAIR